ncbi:ribonuclease E inhibitor RraB [Pokkaliibacter sp. MBI-7]|uniref:ribonuclease E inhibitor RraB n=1 Tax=Pokkaliibacter sp. MBI-7 TaxID=3040600 RepID=UPI00244AC3B4|nr:ribonuclease E inhibitor RraB [Pokkaliibacter sp. MBI-7]MDH2433646.1 ribonuclease E inhibitor RraB [Pokkaliibacter sp. MBI-7]
MSVIDKLLETAYHDTELLISNDQKGDQFSIPRDVDFVFYASEQGKAETVASFVQDNRYGSTLITPTEEGRVRLVVTVNMPTTQSVLCSVSGLMACLSALFGLDYDGWGCVLQAAPGTGPLGNTQ